MNIGIDARPVLKYSTGVGNYVLNLILALSRQDHENPYHLFFSSYRDRPVNLPWVVPPANWHVKDYHLPSRLMNFLWNNMGKLSFNLLLDEVDIFHFTGDIAYPLKNIPTIATICDLYHLRHPECVDKKFRIDQPLFIKKIKAVSKIIAISEFTKQDLIELCGIQEKKIIVIHLGVDHSVFQTSDPLKCAALLKARFHLEEDFLLSVGTIETRKNYPRLIEAFRQIREKHPSLKLVLAGGKGWGFDQVEATVRFLGMESSVLLTGYLQPEELTCLYGCARAFVMTSQYEGFGLPLLEAFACGIPSAVSNCTALSEIAGDAALLFDPNQTEDIAEKILQALENDDALKEKGVARARQFSWEDTARKTLEIYKSLEKNVT
ncbi:MAG: glycosyltransferase family 1 protein [Nitrospinota bacterium]|nr:glycosyltransferase family 1 protein [Nitrospinota bacterium]